MSGQPAAVEIIPRADGIELTVKVVPGASRTKVAGVWGNALKLAVAAPPEGGKANAAVTELLAKTLGVKKGAVEIVSGHGQPVKRVAVTGITVERARAVLAM
jgi:uncharacterized protein (TIGR00251 family)